MKKEVQQDPRSVVGGYCDVHDSERRAWQQGHRIDRVHNLSLIHISGGWPILSGFANVSLKESARWVGSSYIQARMSFWP